MQHHVPLYRFNLKRSTGVHGRHEALEQQLRFFALAGAINRAHHSSTPPRRTAMTTLPSEGLAASRSQTAINDLRGHLRGQLLQPGDPAYDTTRAIWNGMIDRRPALIVSCAGVADVIAAVHFARLHDMVVSVRGGGHNVAGNAVSDGGLMIDLSGMKSVRVDPARQTARAEPGLTWGELDHETHAFGLATPGGIQSTTGIAGFTLGGGIGWLTRAYGLTCDNLLSVDIVTAEGELLRACETENADLFWGIRGGGGNFGIVTSFEFRLHAVRDVLGGMLVHRLEEARELLQFYRDYVQSAPDELGMILFFVTLPVAPWVPERLHGVRAIAVGVCYAGDLAEGERAVKPLREFGSPEIDLVRVMPYTELQTMTDAANPPGQHNYWKAEYIAELPDQAIQTLIDYAAMAPTPLSKCLFTLLGGAMARVRDEETAFGHRRHPFICNIMSMCPDRASSETGITWARRFWSAMQPFSGGGVYVNFLGNEGEERVRAAYPPQTYERLVALKNTYDPTNFFRLNQNIKPNAG
jgi:FAD/FMN-containing dehydrogenase